MENGHVEVERKKEARRSREKQRGVGIEKGDETWESGLGESEGIGIGA